MKKHLIKLLVILFLFSFENLHAQNPFSERFSSGTPLVFSVSSDVSKIHNSLVFISGFDAGALVADEYLVRWGMRISNNMEDQILIEDGTNSGLLIDARMLFTQFTFGNYGDLAYSDWYYNWNFVLGAGSLFNTRFDVSPKLSTLIFQPEFIVYKDLTYALQLGVGVNYRNGISLESFDRQNIRIHTLSLGIHLRFSE